MLLTSEQQKEITALVKYSLDAAQQEWNKHGVALARDSSALTATFESAEQHPSKIPGHSTVSETILDQFIALVADIRGSSQHLLCAISPKIAKVSMLQRVYYETSALLPALEKAVQYKGGNVTEYLGDGILAFFRVDESDISKTIYAAHAAAKICIMDVREIVNNELHHRYQLPPLNIGVGLALSKGLVTLMGLDGEKHPKVFGECVYRATKLSYGNNEVIVDENLKAAWPVAKNGGFSFIPKNQEKRGVPGYGIPIKNT